MIDGSMILPISAPKVFRHGDFVVGAVGDYRVSQMARQKASHLLDQLKSTEDFQDRIEEAIIKPHCALLKEYSNDNEVSVRFMLACPWGVFAFDPLLACLSYPNGHLACIGSGEVYALGAGFALKGASPHEQVTAGLNAAVALDSGCGGAVFVDERVFSCQ